MTLVSVFLPIYNDKKYIDDVASSVLTQTCRDFRFLILENGSRDGTRQELRKLSDPRIELVEAHINLRSETAVRLFNGCETKYIAPIYSDDMYVPEKLEKCLAALEETGADACFSNIAVMDEQKRPIRDEHIPVSLFPGDISTMSVPEHLWHFAFRGNTLHPVAMVIRTDVVRELGGLRGDMHQIGDMDFFTRLLLRKNVIFLQEKLVRIRVREGGSNESTVTPASMSKIRGERLNFIANYRSPEALTMVDQIFLPSVRGISVRPEFRLWFLGQQFVNNFEPDYRFFGTTCMYDALKQNGAEIESGLTAALGITPGAYMDQIASRIFADFAANDAGKDFELQKRASENDTFQRENRRLAAALDSRASQVEELRQHLIAGGKAARAELVSAPVYPLGELLNLTSSGSKEFLASGFSTQEDWGVWTDGASAEIRFRLGAATSSALICRLWPAMVFRQADQPQTVRIILNGQEAFSGEVVEWQAIEFPIAGHLFAATSDNVLQIVPGYTKRHSDEPIGEPGPSALGFTPSCSRLRRRTEISEV